MLKITDVSDILAISRNHFLVNISNSKTFSLEQARKAQMGSGARPMFLLFL
jgi:hypothetical protein